MVPRLFVQTAWFMPNACLPPRSVEFWYLLGRHCLCDQPPVKTFISWVSNRLPWVETKHTCATFLLLGKACALPDPSWHAESIRKPRPEFSVCPCVPLQCCYAKSSPRTQLDAGLESSSKSECEGGPGDPWHKHLMFIGLLLCVQLSKLFGLDYLMDSS